MFVYFPYSDHQDRQQRFEGGLDNSTNDFDVIENATAEKRRAQDFDDLQNEASGNEVGRIPRFLSPEARAILIEKRNGKQSAAMSALDIMLLENPEYAEFYGNAMDKLADYEQAAETALTNALDDAERGNVALKDIVERAATLPDGTRVFRDANGEVWSESGEKIARDVAEKIEWQGSEPSREVFLQQLKSNQAHEKAIIDIRLYQSDVLGTTREWMANPDKPPSMEDIQEKFDEIELRMPDSVRAEIPASAHIDSQNDFEISVPKL